MEIQKFFELLFKKCDVKIKWEDILKETNFPQKTRESRLRTPLSLPWANMVSNCLVFDIEFSKK